MKKWSVVLMLLAGVGSAGAEPESLILVPSWRVSVGYLDAAEKHSGKYSLRADKPQQAKGVSFSRALDGFQRGQTAVVEAYVKSSHPGDRIRLELISARSHPAVYNGELDTDRKTASTVVTAEGEQWVKVSVSMVLPHDPRIVYARVTSSKKAPFWLDDVSMRWGPDGKLGDNQAPNPDFEEDPRTNYKWKESMLRTGRSGLEARKASDRKIAHALLHTLVNEYSDILSEKELDEALGHLGHFAARQGRFDDAIFYQEQALAALHRRHPNWVSEAEINLRLNRLDELVRLNRLSGRLGIAYGHMQEMEQATAAWPAGPEKVLQGARGFTMSRDGRYGPWLTAMQRIRFLDTSGRPQEALEEALALDQTIQSIETRRRIADVERTVQVQLQGFIAEAYAAQWRFDEARAFAVKGCDGRVPRFDLGFSHYYLNALRKRIITMRRDDQFSYELWTESLKRLEWVHRKDLPPENIRAKLLFAELGWRYDKVGQTLPKAEEAVKEAREASARLLLPEALLTRARLKLLEGGAAGAAADLDEALAIARELGLKNLEPDLYHIRARVHFTLGQDALGFAVMETAHQLALLYGDDCLALQALVDIANRQLELGRYDDARATWKRIDALLADRPFSEARLVALKKTRSEHQARLAAAPQPPELAGAGTTGTGTPTGDGSGEGTTLPPAEGVAPNQAEMDLQPWAIETVVASDEASAATFYLMNASGAGQNGALRVSSSSLKPEWVASGPPVEVLLARSQAGGAVERSLPVPHGDPLALKVYLPAGAAGTADRVDVSWTGASGLVLEASWQLGAERASRRVRVTHDHLMRENPFFHIPFHHLVHVGAAGGVRDMRVTCSEPCRVELIDERRGTLLAVDANGDGDFLDAGDVLHVDVDQDGFPEVRGGDDGACEVAVFVYPVTLSGSREVEVVLELQHQDGWRAESVDLLVVEK